MSDLYETSRIRRGLSVLMDEAPVAPEFEDLTATYAEPLTLKKPAPIAAVVTTVAVTAVFAVGGLLLAGSGGPSQPAAQPVTDTTIAQPTPTTAAAPATTAQPEENDAPLDVEAVASEFLQDIPLPDGLDPSTITTSITAADLDRLMEDEELPPGLTRTEVDRYNIGAHVTGAATCAWIEQWLDATAAGDQQRVDEAVSALGTSRSWSVLAEMGRTGDWPEQVWQYADAVAGDGTVTMGLPGLTVAETYPSALGCPDL